MMCVCLTPSPDPWDPSIERNPVCVRRRNVTSRGKYSSKMNICWHTATPTIPTQLLVSDLCVIRRFRTGEKDDGLIACGWNVSIAITTSTLTTATTTTITTFVAVSRNGSDSNKRCSDKKEWWWYTTAATTSGLRLLLRLKGNYYHSYCYNDCWHEHYAYYILFPPVAAKKLVRWRVDRQYLKQLGCRGW